MYRYLALFDPCPDISGWYSVTFPDVPGAITHGENITNAREMATDALEVILGRYITKGEDLPVARTKRGKGGHWIEPSALAQIKLALYVEFRRAHVSKTGLARKMGIAKQQIDRLFDLQHSSRVEQLEGAFRAIGKTLTISVEDAA